MKQENCQHYSNLLVWQYRLQTGTWHQTPVYADTLHEAKTEDPELLVGKSKIAIIFSNASNVSACQRCQRYFTGAFHIPDLWWSGYCKNSNGYFGFEETRERNGKVTGYNTWALLQVKQLLPDNQHVWYRLNIFIRWIASSQQTVIILFHAPLLFSAPLRYNPTQQVAENLPNPLLDGLPTPLLDNLDVDHLQDPFWFYVPVMDELARLQDDSVWTIRDHVRKLELTAMPEGNFDPNYRLLHDIARHAIHVIETLDVSAKTIESLLLHHQDWMMTSTAAPDNHSVPKAIHRRLLFYEHLIVSLRHRSASNKERLSNEIHLAFNTVAQHDSGVAVQIGQAAQADSAAMKTIAFITMAFLPPTFISAIFSMSFFNYDADSGRWAVSDKFWLYWAFAVPTTLLTAVLWYLWRRFYLPQFVGLERKNSGLSAAKEKRALWKSLRTLRAGEDVEKEFTTPR